MNVYEKHLYEIRMFVLVHEMVSISRGILVGDSLTDEI